jgi:hypothetical protein
MYGSGALPLNPTELVARFSVLMQILGKMGAQHSNHAQIRKTKRNIQVRLGWARNMLKLLKLNFEIFKPNITLAPTLYSRSHGFNSLLGC